MRVLVGIEKFVTLTRLSCNHHAVHIHHTPQRSVPAYRCCGVRSTHTAREGGHTSPPHLQMSEGPY